MNSYHPTTYSYKQGAKTLPREYYISDKIFDIEQEKIFAQQWCCVGRVSQLGKPGDFFVAELAGESLVITKDSTDSLKCFFNVCRHRGTQICNTAHGHFAMNIQCPYHAWTYNTSGNLIAAPHMVDVKNFNKELYGLHEAAIESWEGFIFVSIARKPKPFSQLSNGKLKKLKRFELVKLQVGHKVIYDIHTNWKLVFQNYNECLHCPSIHPKLARTLPYLGPTNDFTSGVLLGGPMAFTPPNVTATMSGQVCGRYISDSISKSDQKLAFYYTLMPNFILSIHPDYANYYIIKPLASNRTIVESEWLFHPDTLAKKKNTIHDAIEFWDITNRQDWDIIERSQLGISSRRYTPGPYSPRESIPAAWDREYLRIMNGK